MLPACAHERASVAQALQCGEDKLQLVAEAPMRKYQRPRTTAAAEAALSGAAAAVGALTSLVGGGSGSGAYYLPAGSVQLAAPGWRHYEGCARALVCFDGGFCLEGDDLAGARAVPALMEKSRLELTGELNPETECMEPQAWADRRGPLVWTLSRCSASFACKVAEGGYSCSDERGRAVDSRPKAR
jgi:hypothetical protein